MKSLLFPCVLAGSFAQHIKDLQRLINPPGPE